MEKKAKRVRRRTKTRAKISERETVRLSVHRTPRHIYATLLSPTGSKVLAAASSVEKVIKDENSNGGNKIAAEKVGKLIAERAKEIGIVQVAFDRSGFKYHGRIKALADAARQGGIEF